MEIIANTSNGYLITATGSEVKEILRSVNGTIPKEILIGQKIPAIDYASTITKIHSLSDSYDYKQLLDKVSIFNKSLEELKTVIQNSSEI